MLQNIKARNTGKVISTFHPMHFIRGSWFRYAAILLLILSACAFYYLLPPKHQKVIAIEKNAEIPAPATMRATLTLANGAVIFLDSAASGTLVSHANADIEKLENGNIVYHAKTLDAEIQYNTLTVPKGSRIANIILSDGSKVFLNVGSSMKYPVVFDGKERKVEITGEAYFEVAKNPSKKFVVVSRNISTEVLGTEFNINAYPDENTSNVTLLEGSVKVKKQDMNIILKPGEQVVDKGDQLYLNSHANLNQVLAWKKDYLFLKICLWFPF